MTTTSIQEQKKGLKGWSTRDLLVVAVIGIVFGLLTIPVHLVVTSLEMLSGPIGSRVIVGIFFVPGLMAPYIVRRPGAALLATLISSLVQVPANPYGWAVIALSLVNGVPVEVAFLVTRYRRFSLVMMMITGALVVVPGYFGHAAGFGYANLSLAVVVGGLVMAMVSTAVLGGWLAKALADAIARTGVLNSFAIAQAQQEDI